MEEAILGIMLGVGLSAACGFRVFVPCLVVALAMRSGHVTPGAGFEWLYGNAALWILGTATVVEIVGYYVPVIDNLLDTVGLPAAALAGTILTASLCGSISPELQWTLAAIAGGGTAAVVHTGTAAVRAVSTGTTGGVGNWLFSTGEAVVSTVAAVLALMMPIVMGVVTILLVGLIIWLLVKFWGRLRDAFWSKRKCTSAPA